MLCYAKSLQSCPTLCDPIDSSHQAPLSLGFSRQEHWRGLLFPSPMHESESEVAQLCPTLSNPMDCNLPGSSIHGIFWAKYWSGVPLPSETSNSCRQFFQSSEENDMENYGNTGRNKSLLLNLFQYWE